MVDGPGIRTAVFFKGCNLSCLWCHNPESQCGFPEVMIYHERCIQCGNCVCGKEVCNQCGECVERCPVGARKLVGRTATTDSVMKEIIEDKPFYGNEGGVTFTGGECMIQSSFLLNLLKECKKEAIHTAVDTAGNVPWHVFADILPYVDLFLYDIKMMSPEAHKKYTGVDNKLILENLQNLLSMGKKVHVRIPVIPGVNDGDEELTMLKIFLSSVPRPDKVELLPYHTMGEGKYIALGKSVTKFSVPSAESISQMYEKLEF